MTNNGFNKKKAWSFWQTATLDELASEQGNMAIGDIDEIAGYWPVNDDLDALLAFVLDERTERRRISSGGDS